MEGKQNKTQHFAMERRYWKSIYQGNKLLNA